MCQIRPYPRCSNDGLKRRNKAVDHHNEMKTRHDAHPTKENADLYYNSQQRLAAAQEVWYNTPKGLEELQSEVTQLEEALETAPRGNAGTPARETFNKLTREHSIKKNQHSAYEESREAKKADGKATEIEHASAQVIPEGVDVSTLTPAERRAYSALPQINQRKIARSMARSRGANVGRNAQPNYQEAFDAAIDNIPNVDAYVRTLKPWTNDQLGRVDHWVEKGAEPKVKWAETSVAKPRDIQGTKVGKTQTRLTRLNTPDGQVVEGRADVMVVKKDNGQYDVVEVLTVGSSWEDAAPGDVTQQPLGHMLTGDANLNRSRNVTTFATLDEAERAVKKSKNKSNQTFKKDVASVGRQQFINRIRHRAGKMQIRGWRAWPRYEADKTIAE